MLCSGLDTAEARVPKGKKLLTVCIPGIRAFPATQGERELNVDIHKGASTDGLAVVILPWTETTGRRCTGVFTKMSCTNTVRFESFVQIHANHSSHVYTLPNPKLAHWGLTKARRSYGLPTSRRNAPSTTKYPHSNAFHHVLTLTLTLAKKRHQSSSFQRILSRA